MNLLRSCKSLDRVSSAVTVVHPVSCQVLAIVLALDKLAHTLNGQPVAASSSMSGSLELKQLLLHVVSKGIAGGIGEGWKRHHRRRAVGWVEVQAVIRKEHCR
jgi:hypothetical protein